MGEDTVSASIVIPRMGVISILDRCELQLYTRKPLSIFTRKPLSMFIRVIIMHLQKVIGVIMRRIVQGRPDDAVVDTCK